MSTTVISQCNVSTCNRTYCQETGTCQDALALSQPQQPAPAEPAPGYRWIQATLEEWDAVQRLRAAAAVQPPVLPLTEDEMRAIFLANGFTIKEGHTDLKPYVYAAGRAIEAKVRGTGSVPPSAGEVDA